MEVAVLYFRSMLFPFRLDEIPNRKDTDYLDDKGRAFLSSLGRGFDS